MAKPLSDVERIKRASRRLRGTLEESLAATHTGSLAPDDTQLIKLHGSYQQDDRDVREERRQQKLEPAWEFMIRTRLPGGVCRPDQWLVLDDLARTHGNGSLRITTRQAFQLHGVLKTDLKATIAGMNRALVDTFAACGDVNRNVLCNPDPIDSRAHEDVYGWAVKLSEHLLPRTRAYHEIWLDGEKVAGPEEEPIYGDTYLPRKFKVAIAVPPDNDVDVLAHDLGFVAILEDGRVAGFDVAIGGGMGMAHGEPGTYPRLADVIGFVPPERLLDVATAVVTTQRDYGDRSDRKHARLKYTIADRGLAWFVAEVQRRARFELEPARPYAFAHNGDRFGWRRGHDGSSSLCLHVESGRLKDAALDGMRDLARVHRGTFRLTPNQNVIVAGVPEGQRAVIDAIVAAHSLGGGGQLTPLRREALSCVALPTCALAMAEAERYLPDIAGKLDERLAAHGLSGERLTFRITGCPNGCARPYLAEIALVGKAPGRYNLHVGGNGAGTRLNRLYRENVDEAGALQALEPLLSAWAAERRAAEGFGDFLVRTERIG